MGWASKFLGNLLKHKVHEGRKGEKGAKSSRILPFRHRASTPCNKILKIDTTLFFYGKRCKNRAGKFRTNVHKQKRQKENMCEKKRIHYLTGWAQFEVTYDVLMTRL